MMSFDLIVQDEMQRNVPFPESSSPYERQLKLCSVGFGAPVPSPPRLLFSDSILYLVKSWFSKLLRAHDILA